MPLSPVHLLVGALALALPAASLAHEWPAWIPWPKQAQLLDGDLRLGPGSRIVAVSDSLLPLGKVLAAEIAQVAHLNLPVVKGRGRDGDIVLRLDPKLAGEAYRLDVGPKAEVAAGNYPALAFGTVSLLWALQSDGVARWIPHLRVRDEPFASYRGVMVDVARRWHSLDVLKQCVLLCRLYKIRYLQLHLSDDQAFTFPCKAFPLLNTSSSNGGPAYTLQDVSELERFAAERGVAIVPEIEMPGHAATMVRTMPELFKIRGTQPYEHHASLNFVKEEVVRALDVIVGEVCDVFKTTPYFHIGGDEADISLADQNPDFQAAFAAHGLKGKAQWEMYRWFLGRMNEVVKKHGKKMIVWEGFGKDPQSKFPVPKDVTVMEFESSYQLPQDLIDDGYPVINAAWTPLYLINRHVWQPRKVYDWNLYRFGRFSQLWTTTAWFDVKPTRQIVGAQVCAWEQPEYWEISNLRHVVPAMAERTWNPSRRAGYENFDSRLRNVADWLLDALVHSVRFETAGLTVPQPDEFDDRRFASRATVAMKSSTAGLTIRYTTDGTPVAATSARFTKPLELAATTILRAAAFDSHGRRVGYETSDVYTFDRPREPNLATGKPVTASAGTQHPQDPALVVDGNLDLGSSWWASPAPQWLKIDLLKVCSVERIKVYPYWDGARSYQYTVEVSEDGKTWLVVGDRSANTAPATPAGEDFKIGSRRVRYVRVNMLHNTANAGVHLVEVEVFGSAPP